MRQIVTRSAQKAAADSKVSGNTKPIQKSPVSTRRALRPSKTNQSPKANNLKGKISTQKKTPDKIPAW